MIGRVTGLLVVGLLTSAAAASGVQSMRAATTLPGPDLSVVLTWPTASPSARVNLYRKPAGAAAYPGTPLNGQPIARLSSCAAIQAIITPGSEDWQFLANGLASGGIQFDPCTIATLAAGSQAEERFQLLARTRWRIAVVGGQGYRDAAVSVGKTYEYELRRVNAVGKETGVLFSGVSVTAGSPEPIAAPAGLTATAGDRRVLLLWGDQPTAAGFVVLRATAAGGPYARVNEATLAARIKQDLDGKPLAGGDTNGFLDVQRWSADGQPIPHTVNMVPINGPFDGVTYFYQVASVDLLGQAGPATTAVVSATPVDTTPPAAPAEVGVTAVDSQSRLEVLWTLVPFDVDGHAESAPLAGHRVYRYESENAPLGAGVQVGGVVPPPPAGVTFQTLSDSDPVLRPPFGEQPYWYRVEALDAAGNVGTLSAAVSGRLKDVTPPHPPVGVAAEGADDFIHVTWDANSEPDLDGYLVYRSLCHNGAANPCDPPPPREQPSDQRQDEQPSDQRKEAKDQPPCTGTYVLVGTVYTATLAAGALPSFDDRTIPAGSPLCYSYWIKAFDRSQNRSGSWPVPDPLTEQTVCQRLRDKTPPEAAITSGLFARDGGIRVEWVGPPVQDIRAYHVYRSEHEAGPYTWVGGMTVEPPPASPVPLAKPYQAPPAVGCKTIPVVAIESMSMGAFLDTHVDPKVIYWYKVVGIDQSGNEAPLATAAPVSTFTFTNRLPPPPQISSITPVTGAAVGLVIRWTPAYDPAHHRGFAVFRSDRVDGLYRQIGTLLTDAQYEDDLVVAGVPYWYKVVVMDQSGQVSLPSLPTIGLVAP